MPINLSMSAPSSEPLFIGGDEFHKEQSLCKLSPRDGELDVFSTAYDLDGVITVESEPAFSFLLSVKTPMFIQNIYSWFRAKYAVLNESPLVDRMIKEKHTLIITARPKQDAKVTLHWLLRKIRWCDSVTVVFPLEVLRSIYDLAEYKITVCHHMGVTTYHESCPEQRNMMRTISDINGYGITIN